MRKFGTRAALAMLLFSAAGTAHADDAKTWYVYCEGQGHGTHWAVFSENVWPYPDSENYGRRVGSAAEEHFEATHEVKLSGCSGVNFFDVSTAEFSRDRTVRLHKKLGDEIYFFPLPRHVFAQ